MGYLLGLDFGTGGIRVGVFDPDTRRTIAAEEETYPSTHARPGWAEQSPADWWDALGRASRRLFERARHPEIDAIAVATTASTVVACRKDGTPLRPALLWMDCRAGAEAARTAESRHPVMAYSGGGDAAEWLVPKAMWLSRHEPETWRDADMICECLDWINHALTGLWVASRMNATCKWNLEPALGAFVPDLYRELGIAGLEHRLPPDVLAVGTPIGRISEAAASHLGLRTRPVLAQGGIDAHIGLLGADVIDPGKLLLIGGTSVVHLFHLGSERPMPGFWGPYPHALIPDLWMVEGGQVSAGSVLTWLSRTMFGLDDPGVRDLIDAAIARPAAGSDLVTLDYFMGNRTPYRDPLLRGAVLGLTLGHDRVALYRSAVESIALASANVVRAMQANDVPVERIVLSGGIARNPLWLQATVDAIGMPVELAGEENLTIVGCAAAAGTAVGRYASLRDAARDCASPGRWIMPDPAAHQVSVGALERYRAATRLLSGMLRDLSAGERPVTAGGAGAMALSVPGDN